MLFCDLYLNLKRLIRPKKRQKPKNGKSINNENFDFTRLQ